MMNSVVTGKPKGFCSWSGGKDCSLALQTCREKGMVVNCLVCMLDETGERSRSHGLRLNLLRKQAELLGCSLATAPTTWANYESTFRNTLAILKENGYSFGVFGDLDGESNRRWEEDLCSYVGMTAEIPLWGLTRQEVTDRFINTGIVSVICTCIRPLQGFLGKELTASAMDQIEALGYDRCGENGEYHSVTLAAPRMSMTRIIVRTGVVVPVGNGGDKLAIDLSL